MKDNLAIFFSGMCLLHCLAFPILFVLGISGAMISWFEAEWIHRAFLVPVFLLAVISLPHAYKQHECVVPLLLGGLGIAITLSSFMLPESLELWLLVPSALLLISAHTVNKRLLMTRPVSVEK